MKGTLVDDIHKELVEEYAYSMENIDLLWQNSYLTSTLDSHPLFLFAEDGKRVVFNIEETEKHLAPRKFESVLNKRTVIYGKEGKFLKFDIKEETRTLEIQSGKKWKFMKKLNFRQRGSDIDELHYCIYF